MVYNMLVEKMIEHITPIYLKERLKGVKLPRMFKPKTSSLRGFDKGETLIVFSSLYPITMDKSVIKPTNIKKIPILGTPTTTAPPGIKIPNNRYEMDIDPVISPIPLTGVFDSFGLAHLAVALAKSEINFDLIIDPISDKEKKNNLILFGGPSSNLVARELYNQHISNAEFRYGEGYGTIIFKGTTYGTNSGHIGHVLKCKNPWNQNRQILWLAGMGAEGTEAAVRFMTQEFDTDRVPKIIKETPYWIAIVEGIITDGYITEGQYRGGKSLA